ncbi:MAG TPA: HAD family hydrolase [Candidatus Acidoferrales bacterium]|nr:HAD family hydrolase [Candidatus Acidoferrales bacterium]
MTIKLIAMDIDGTLLNSRAELPEQNALAVAEAASRGIEIVLVTGRRFDFARPIADALHCDLHLIVNNGALIKSKNGETHQQHLLPSNIARQVLEATTEFRANAGVCFNRPLDRQMVFEKVDWDDPRRSGYFRRNRAYIAEVSPLEDCLNGEDPIQVLYTGACRPIRAAMRQLSALPIAEAFTLALTEYESRDFSILDVLRLGVNKGVALKEWSRRKGVAREEVMAIGDNWNDREMLEFAGLPVVMANSVEDLKGFGWTMTSSNNENGVAAAINTYALGKI